MASDVLKSLIMSKDPDRVNPQPGEGKLEDLPAEWVQDDIKDEHRKPDLGEIEEDPSEE